MDPLQGALVARRARAGETVDALNGKTYDLTPEMTEIADDRGVLARGGEHDHPLVPEPLLGNAHEHAVSRRPAAAGPPSPAPRIAAVARRPSRGV